MPAKKDLTGKKFGKLKVLEFSHSQKMGNYTFRMWKVRCDCGTLKTVKGAHLMSGDTKSCGCYNKAHLAPGEASMNTLISNYKRHAKNRNLDWGLSKEEVRKVTKLNCYYCGSEPKQEARNKRCNGTYIYNGIDRVDNSKGYFLDNCVPCCGVCNRLKSDMSYTEFKQHIQKIWKTIKEKS